MTKAPAVALCAPLQGGLTPGTGGDRLAALEQLAQRFSEGGSIELNRPGNGLLLVKLSGRLEADWGPWLTALLEEQVAHGMPTLFVDTSELGSFTGPFKSHMLQWMRNNRGQLAAAHVLTLNPMVRVAAAVANIALRGWITAHGDADTFMAAMIPSASAAASP